MLSQLLAHGSLLAEYGSSPGDEVPTVPAPAEGDVEGHSPPMVSIVIDMVCGCSQITDDQVHMQIIKALVLSIAREECEVHDSQLLVAIRTCYSLYLTSKAHAVCETAKAGLTQMLHVVFERMEREHRRGAVTSVPPEAVATEDGAPAEPSESAAVATTGQSQDTAADTTAIDQNPDVPVPLDGSSLFATLREEGGHGY